MLAPRRSRLAGLVEVDETEIACRRKNDPVTGGRGRSHQSKMLIVGSVEVEDGGRSPGRIRLSQVADCLLGRSPTAPDCGWRGFIWAIPCSKVVEQRTSRAAER